DADIAGWQQDRDGSLEEGAAVPKRRALELSEPACPKPVVVEAACSDVAGLGHTNGPNLTAHVRGQSDVEQTIGVRIDQRKGCGDREKLRAYVGGAARVSGREAIKRSAGPDIQNMHAAPAESGW